MKKRLSLLLAMVLVISSFLIACSGSDEPAQSKSGKSTNNPGATREDSKDTIVVGMSEAKGEFSPVYYSTTYDGYIIDLVYDAMVRSDDKGEIIPHVAKEWDISDDHKTYTMKLRNDVKFSDGEPLTAKDVEFTYLLLMDPSYDGRYTTIASEIEGFEEYNEDKEGKITNASGIKVIDDYTIEFTFKEALVTNIRQLSMGIMPKHLFKDYKKGDIKPIKDQMDKPVGSGMYTLESHEPKQFIKLKANDKHFAGKPKIENMIIKFTTAETMVSELQKGTIDIQVQLPPTEENKEMLSESKFLDISSYPANSYGYLGFNMKDERLSDKNVRQALVCGFNRQQFVDNYYKGNGNVLNIPISSVSWAYTDDVNKNEYNEEKAKELLEKAGWKVGADGIREKDGKKLEFVWDTYTESKYVDALIPMIKADWEKIGVKVEANLMEFNALTTKVYTDRDFEMYNMAWSLTGDPGSLYTTFHSSVDRADGNNSVGYNNEKNDKLLEDGRKEFDQEKRKDIYKEFSKLFSEELPYMIIDQSDQWEVYNKRIKNFKTDSLLDWTSPDVILNLEIEN